MKLVRSHRIIVSASLSVFLAGCGAPNYSQSDMHITVEEVDSQKPVTKGRAPALVKASPTAPLLSSREDSDTYDVIVTNVPVRDLLFALARDAGINMDVDDEVGGIVSISALDQTLDAILARIGEQVAIRVEYLGDAIIIKPDFPYFQQYNVSFLNVSRTYSSSAAGGGVGGGGASAISNSGQSAFWENLEASISSILGVSYQARASAGAASVGGNAQIAASTEGKFQHQTSFTINREAGILVVRAPQRLHKEVQLFLDTAFSVAKRQVLLEATVVEVVLNNQYNQGIDWSLFNSLATEGLALYQGGKIGSAAGTIDYLTRTLTRNYGNVQNLRSEAAAQVYVDQWAADQRAADNNPNRSVTSSTRPTITPATQTVRNADGSETQQTVYNVGAGTIVTEEFNLEAAKRGVGGGLVPATASGNNFFTGVFRKGDIGAAVQLLDQFGDAKVLSSPRISALNNQPALLRVVDQEVYFNIEVDDEYNETTGTLSGRSYTVEENTVDVGFVMNVFPNISDDGEIILNLKPSVTRVLDYRTVPSPSLPGGVTSGTSTQNVVPITRIRELESLISLRDGEVAVMGGLLEDRTGDNSSSVPGISKLPGVGTLFEKKEQKTYKTEFIVFLRARIITNPSVNGDYSDYRHLLPDTDFILRDTGSYPVVPGQEDPR